MSKTLILTAVAATLLAAPAMAQDMSCSSLTGQYKRKYEPIISNFYAMTDKDAQCKVGRKYRQEIRNFGKSLKGGCAGTSSKAVVTARDDVETFGLTVLQICGPQ